ncbi:1,4-dihydroxy-2-naphthoate polyprenyltransferase [Virgibacillus dakarensis]|uniref:1,4-dihydroxy-2-naphthoate octaprenyltransferase n=1 Tax=Lentibacillus populi TaxID=1827502 RepID=A0A9W5X4P2_9BACI|nr:MULTISPECIES: 1,4-dihydroxy-2-naphthoate polyprenyltransferase [Bacillaceae]MBT2217058.1 1,4-dihydroxy-2-naphthoate polyprenyltransferase [Virgibacillus dakarensis]MTW84654.1 1,4-dihydroxy-2-naphthoate polyprenyltransferase [Virgibacillus dakarensis]GGB36844.1 1,4-dihydroxy-2-naphthoate octaprenyltransferase [Lentibacillus populi]
MHSTDKTNIKHVLNEKEGFQIWWRLLRPHTLTASFVPVFVGTMLAYIDGSINIPLFLAMLVASMLIQSATNMFNEYYDFVRGLDNEQSVGIGGTIVRDGIPAKTVLNLAIAFFGIAMLLGIYICAVSSWWIAVIGLVCMLFGYLYTGGPLPIAYTPLGELFSGFLMGTVIIGISYYIQTLAITATVVLVSIPVAIFIGSIMMSNNIRDLDGDKENGRKTIAILLGRKNAVRFLGILFFIAFGLTAYYIIDGLLPVWSIIVFISAVKAVDVVKKFQGKTKPLEMVPAMIATGKTNTIYGFLLGVSLLLSKLF